MTRLTAAILPGLAILPSHAATTALQCERLFDSRGGASVGVRTIVVRDVDLVMMHDVICRTPAS